jgi:hypothetical protein
MTRRDQLSSPAETEPAEATLLKLVRASIAEVRLVVLAMCSVTLSRRIFNELVHIVKPS